MQCSGRSADNLSEGLGLGTGNDCSLRLWDVENGYCRQTIQEHSGEVTAAVWLPSGTTIISGGHDKFMVRRTLHFSLPPSAPPRVLPATTCWYCASPHPPPHTIGDHTVPHTLPVLQFTEHCYQCGLRINALQWRSRLLFTMPRCHDATAHISSSPSPQIYRKRCRPATVQFDSTS